jgi:hypothetical protein
MLKKIVDYIIALGKRHPYTHLFHADGDPYMRRYWLMPRWLLQELRENPYDASTTYYKPKRWVPFSLRIHQIVTADYDKHMHDHPWSFLSLVLRGWYVEARPITTEPCFSGYQDEASFIEDRTPGTVAFRRATDRHRILQVSFDCWTLVVLGPKRHWWGFFTPAGKIHWKEYPSVHNYVARTEST